MWLTFFHIMETLVTVSYTHLDVYKGQHIQTVTDVVAEVGDKINLPESLTEAVKAMPDSELMSVIREYGEASVSYTHLTIKAFVVNKDMKEFELKLDELTDDERQIILDGCLINYYRENK